VVFYDLSIVVLVILIIIVATPSVTLVTTSSSHDAVHYHDFVHYHDAVQPLRALHAKKPLEVTTMARHSPLGTWFLGNLLLSQI
jgi:hypothetical protein